MEAAAFEQVYEAFGEFHSFFAPLFGRRESRDHSQNYLRALLVQSQDRRNAENLSESVGVPARAMQRFLTAAPWDDDAVMGRLQEYLAPRLGHPEAVWVLDGSDFPKQGRKSAGVWPGSTAAGWARWPTARPGCSWRMSVPWAGRWWTNGCTCRRVGHRTKAGAQRQGCRRRDGATSRRRNWPWSCWSGPWSAATSGPSGLLGTTPSGCRRPSGTPWRRWGCTTCWTSPAAAQCGRWSRLGPVRSIRDSGAPANPSCETVSAGPWSSAAMNCRGMPGGR